MTSVIEICHTCTMVDIKCKDCFLINIKESTAVMVFICLKELAFFSVDIDLKLLCEHLC